MQEERKKKDEDEKDFKYRMQDLRKIMKMTMTMTSIN